MGFAWHWLFGERGEQTKADRSSRFQVGNQDHDHDYAGDLLLYLIVCLFEL